MDKIHEHIEINAEEGLSLKFHIREWNRQTDQAFFDYCQLESYKGTLTDADSLSEEEIKRKYEEFDKNDPVDMSSPDHVVFIGETSEGQPVGLVWVCHRGPFWRFKEPLTWIYNLHVVLRFRRQGLAKLLLEKIEEWTRSEGLKLIGLHVIESNKAARILYDSCGYKLAATHKESCFYEKSMAKSNEK
ncbi:MAG: GNAT family N-acetyltransferase [Candidatus Hermodarchaeota archaeon]|nr:GNAT family N-acetyltransferase [Candidatus Hermodarchaeota archaeon]